jgi:hypothetical protein
MSIAVTMVDPNGCEWTAGSAQEVNDLCAQGYRFKGTGRVTPHAGAAPEPSPAPAAAASAEPPAPAADAPTQESK